MAVPAPRIPMNLDQAAGAARSAMPPPMPGGPPDDMGGEMVTCPKCGLTFPAEQNPAGGPPGAGGPPPPMMGGLGKPPMGP